jgi:hypothetical protein
MSAWDHVCDIPTNKENVCSLGAGSRRRDYKATFTPEAGANDSSLSRLRLHGVAEFGQALGKPQRRRTRLG